MTKYATQTALAATCTTAILLYFHYKNPQWAVMSTLLTMQSCANSQCFESTVIAGFNRAIGAIIGTSIGLAGAWLMNAIASDGFLWIIVGVVYLALYLAVIINQYCKSLQLIPACTIMVITMSLVDAVPTVAFDRAYEVMLGVFIALIFNFIFCPYKQNKQLEKVFYQLIQSCHYYFNQSISPLTDVASPPQKSTKKHLNNLLTNLHDIKKSRLTLLTTEVMLRQQEQIYNTADQLVNAVLHLQKTASHTKKQINHQNHLTAINTAALIIDQQFTALSTHQPASTAALPDLQSVYQSIPPSHTNALPAMMLLHQLSDLYQLTQALHAICWYRGSDSNRHGVTTTRF